MHHDARPRLLLLFRGPKWDLDHTFGHRLALLSRDFRGDVLTTGSRTETRQYGDFTVHARKHGKYATWVSITELLRWALKLRREAGKVDLVIAGDAIKSGLLGLLAARLLGTRLVVEVNGDYEDDVLYADQNTGKVRLARKRIYLALLRFVLRRAHGIKAVYAEQLAKYADVAGQKLTAAFHDYLDLSPFQNRGDERVVLLAGFPLLVKGVDVLMAAFRRVAERHAGWRLVILGWYPQTDVLERHRAGHPGIEVRRPVHHRDMPAQVGRAGICVLASRSEGVPRFLLESMHAGKACIGSRVGGIPTVLKHEVNGLLFDSGDVDGLARCLDRLMGDAELRHRLGKAAEARAAEFSAESYYRQLAPFLRRVLGYEMQGEGRGRRAA